MSLRVGFKRWHIAAISLFVIALVVVPAWTARPKDVEAPPSSSTDNDAPAPQAKVSKQGHEAVERGTDWLLATMRPDGMVGPDRGEPPDLSCTAMVGLTLLSQGNTPQGGKHSAELRRVLDGTLIMVDWLVADRPEMQQITQVQRKIGLNADRFLAALFLSQILGEANDFDPSVRTALERLVRDIASSQGKDGTWGQDSWAPVLGTVLGWESLRGANSCGLEVKASANAAGEALLKGLRKSDYRNESWMHDFYKNAASIRVLYSLGYRNDPAFKECIQAIFRSAQQDDRPFTHAGGEEYLGFFLVTECFLSSPRPEWKTWYPTVSERIIQQQNKDGTWTGHHCITNRTFCTAAAILTIQAPHGCLPISNL